MIDKYMQQWDEERRFYSAPGNRCSNSSRARSRSASRERRWFKAPSKLRYLVILLNNWRDHRKDERP